MSEPHSTGQPAPEIPDPFGSVPIQPTGSVGCGKPMLVGCATVLVLLGVAAIFFMFKAKDVLIWAFGQMEAGVMEKLPEDLSDDEVARLERAFAAATRAAVSGKADTLALQELQRELMGLSARIETLTRADVLSLIEVLERFGGLDGDAPPAEAQPPPLSVEPLPVEVAKPELTSV